MLFWRIGLLVSVLLLASEVVAQEYGSSNYRQPLANGRFEPRRPGEPSKAVYQVAAAPQSRLGRYAPTRPGEVRGGGARARSAPRRPDSSGDAWGEHENRSSRILGTVVDSRWDRELEGFNADQMAAFQDQFLRNEIEKRGKVRLLGKVVTVPVKVLYKVTKKVIGTVALDWWIPLL